MVAVRRFVVNVVLLSACPAMADDWPQWMGPNRDGVWTETGILTKFPAGGPKKLWTVPVSGGYSGPAVSSGKVYLFDYSRTKGEVANSPAKRGELAGSERLHCLDAVTGQTLWSHSYDCPYEVSYPVGPRCTPLVLGNKVYTLGAMGHLQCRDTETGRALWTKHFPTEYKAEVPMWGYASHPIVYQNMLICLAGGPDSLLVAFDKDTGAEQWRSLSPPKDGAGYGTPTLTDVGGKQQLLFWHPAAVVGLDPATGRQHWSVPLKPAYGMSIMAPQRSGNLVFAGGIGHAAVAIRLDTTSSQPSEAWRGTTKTGVYPVNSTPIIDNGVIYAVDQPGELRAVRLDTGERLWRTFLPVVGRDEDEGYTGANSGTAFLVKNGRRFFLFAETGHLVIAHLSPEKYEEIDRTFLIEPTGEAFGRKVVWSHPAFAQKCIFVRNDKQAACYSLAE